MLTLTRPSKLLGTQIKQEKTHRRILKASISLLLSWHQHRLKFHVRLVLGWPWNTNWALIGNMVMMRRTNWT